MKTLVKTFTVAVLVAISTLTMASGNPEKTINLSTANFAIDHYIDVMTEGQSLGLEQLFTADYNQKVQGKIARTNSRSDVINFLKKQKGEKLNCKTTTLILEQSAHYMVAKVTMQFENFTKTDLVTLVNDGGVWKVSKSINCYQ
nr:nuclear transport factor 2 family protein [uncultured Sphingobacterium sp.]